MRRASCQAEGSRLSPELVSAIDNLEGQMAVLAAAFNGWSTLDTMV